MSRMGTLYLDRNTFIHRLDGTVKFLLLLTWTVVTFLFLDLRIAVLMILLGIILIYLAEIPFKVVRPLLWLMIGFNLLNSIFILLITPTYGTELTGTNTAVWNIGYQVINLETIFYVLTLSLKYANLLPITLVFIFTTHPSRFACSLNRIGVPYKIAYAVNIAFRYIPDIQQELRNIINSQQSRGVDFKRGEVSFKQLIKNVSSIAIPLLISSLQRIEVISNAMDLRGFGKYKKRTWYNATKLKRADFIVSFLCLFVLLTVIWLKLKIFSDFWYPF